MTTHPCPPRPARITIVEAPGCHLCADAHEAVAALVEQGYRIEIDTVDPRSADGRTLMQRHRAGLSPLVLVDDTFFSHGRLPRRKLARLIEQRSPEQAPSPAARP